MLKILFRSTNDIKNDFLEFKDLCLYSEREEANSWVLIKLFLWKNGNSTVLKQLSKTQNINLWRKILSQIIDVVCKYLIILHI